MLDEGLIGAIMVFETLSYRRAFFGRPPSRPMRLVPSGLISGSIHLGFHAAATAAPSAPTAIAFVLAGWASFLLWWKWMSRAPKPFWGEGDDGGGGGPGGGGGGGGGPGSGPRDGDDDRPRGDAREIDWDALEREMADYLDPQRELAGAR
jgi:hypothetical protein